MKKIQKISYYLVAITLGLAVAATTFAFTGPTSTPPTGDGYFWRLSGSDLYYPPSGSGKIGIGTASPSYKLDVSGTFRATATSTFSGNVGIGTNNPGYTLDVSGTIHSVGTIYMGSAAVQNVLVFSGYTATTTGNLGGLKGANTSCNAAYAGSHWASIDEILSLGPNYPWTNNAWIRGQTANYADMQNEIVTQVNTPDEENPSIYYREYLPYSYGQTCVGWTSGAATLAMSSSRTDGVFAGFYYRDDYAKSRLYYNRKNLGPYLTTTGVMDWQTCNSTAYLACVK
jgi:hypothetical protein